MRKYLLVLLLFASCKTVQTVRCRATSFKPVVLIGVNGSITTIMVPFCDTLQVIAKVPDTLRVE
jgi:hypothetical protein